MSRTLGQNLLPSKQQKMSQRINAAKKSTAGKSVRRAMEMLIASTPVAPGYNAFKTASRGASKRKSKSKPSPREGQSISMCANKMLLAACDPYAGAAMGACIPDGNVASSVRAFCKAQVVVKIGTSGVGFLQYHACLSNNGCSFTYTDATFAGTTAAVVSATNVTIPGVVRGSLPTPVTSNDLFNGWGVNDDRARFASRLVAAGVSFRYTGTEYFRSGQAYAYVHPAHQSSGSVVNSGGADVAYTCGDLAGFPETLIVEASRAETMCPLIPVGEDELEYSAESSETVSALLYPWSDSGTTQPGGFKFVYGDGHNVGIPILTVMISGTAGQEYVFNIGQHQEIIGIGVNGYARSPPESDPVGVRDLMSAQAKFALNRTRAAGVNPIPEFKRALSMVQKERSNRIRL